MNIQVREDVERGIHISYCPDLDLYSQGTTLDEAKDAIESGVIMWLEICQERGILERELQTRGWDVTA